MINDLLRWKKQSTQDDWFQLATLAKTSVGYLNQVAYGYRRASPEKAQQIEIATKKFNYSPVKKELLVFTNLKSRSN